MCQKRWEGEDDGASEGEQPDGGPERGEAFTFSMIL